MQSCSKYRIGSVSATCVSILIAPCRSPSTSCYNNLRRLRTIRRSVSSSAFTTTVVFYLQSQFTLFRWSASRQVQMSNDSTLLDSFPWVSSIFVIDINSGKVERRFPVSFLSVFLWRHHVQRRCLPPSVFLLPYSGMWGSHIPAKTRSSTMHSASTEGPRVGGMGGSWGIRDTGFSRRMPPSPPQFTNIINYNICWAIEDTLNLPSVGFEFGRSSPSLFSYCYLHYWSPALASRCLSYQIQLRPTVPSRKTSTESSFKLICVISFTNLFLLHLFAFPGLWIDFTS